MGDDEDIARASVSYWYDIEGALDLHRIRKAMGQFGSNITVVHVVAMSADVYCGMVAAFALVCRSHLQNLLAGWDQRIIFQRVSFAFRAGDSILVREEARR